MTVEEWLTALHQSPEVKKTFWYPLALSVMNELPERASALLFARTLRSVLAGPTAQRVVLISSVGQNALYVEGALRFLREHHAEVTTSTEVERLDVDGGSVAGIRLKNGTSISATHVVAAVPYFAVNRMLPPSLQAVKPFSDLPRFQSSPIVSVHLWFDRDWMDMDYVGLIGRTTQWLFNRGRISGNMHSSRSSLSAVISAAYNIVDLDKQEIVAIVTKELKEAFPNSSPSSLIHSVVVKEKRATFSPTIEIEPLRPGTATPLKNFFLAGDWTNTGLPATIEGAVASGLKAAHAILQSG
jgi:zeta-carotene desaturase